MKKPFNSLTTAVWLTICLVALGCQKENETPPEQTAEQLLTDQWWCPTGTFAQQYFGANGSWQQRLRTTDTPDTGKWSFSADKKTINISEVKGGTTTQLFTQWSYSVTKLEAQALELNFSGIAISYNPCP